MDVELLVEMDRIAQGFKDVGRIFVRRYQSVHGETRFTVCDEPESPSLADVTPLFSEDLATGPVKKTHLERGGFNRWNFKRKKR